MAEDAFCALARDWRCLWGLLGPRAAVPEESLICAIGDIHGRAACWPACMTPWRGWPAGARASRSAS